MATEIFRSTVTADCQGQMASMVQHWSLIDSSETDDFKKARDLLGALEEGIPPIGYVNRLQLLLSEDVFLSTIVCQRIFPDGGNSASRVYQRTEAPGAVASPWHTGQVSGCVIWVSSTRPEVTGRNFVPGVPESMLIGGRFETDYQNLIGDWIESVITGYSAASGIFFPVVWDRDDELSYQIDDGYLSSKPGTQRRREKPL